MHTPAAIEVTNLQKSYGREPVLAGIDLRVDAGTVFALLGPNGAGKTTTVRILSTLLAPDGGQAIVAGYDVVRERHLVRRSISLTGQYAAIDEMQTAAENLRMMGQLAGFSRIGARRRATELLKQFNLTDVADRTLSTYSGGMRRRLDIAASLVALPAVLFLDEPTTGLDPRSRRDMWTQIKELVGKGTTIFLTTQYLEEADELADRIAVIDHGRIVAEGTPAELKRQAAGTRLELTFADAAAWQRGVSATGTRLLSSDAQSRTVAIATDGSAACARALLEEIDPSRRDITHFDIREATLDDVFLALTSRS
jgi:ABC-2 type transport system ATP-binding protein